jgi:hypothetical protein
MDEGRFSVSAASLYNRIGTAAAPVLIDVRRRPAFDDDEWMIAGAIRRPPETVAEWSAALPRGRPVAEWSAALPRGRPVAVYCVHGQEVSRNTAASLRGIGIDACYLDALAVIVRGADTSRPELAPQSAGLLALSLGLSANFPDDHEMLEHGLVMYDALYAWCRSCQDETHNWNPAAV